MHDERALGRSENPFAVARALSAWHDRSVGQATVGSTLDDDSFSGGDLVVSGPKLRPSASFIVWI